MPVRISLWGLASTRLTARRLGSSDKTDCGLTDDWDTFFNLGYSLIKGGGFALYVVRSFNGYANRVISGR